MNTTAHQEKLRLFYDRFGARQDAQGFYEERALDRLVARCDFQNASAILEIGCGTGRFAQRLFAGYFPPDARYLGVDISSTMVRLARQALSPWEARAQVLRYEVDDDLPALGALFDRIICTYVFDLMSRAQIEKTLTAARSAACPGAILCCAGLTWGVSPLSRLSSNVWSLVHRCNPYLVGGCRPTELAQYLPGTGWQLLDREVVVASTIPSEVITAKAC